jgi:hypothetical protein
MHTASIFNSSSTSTQWLIAAVVVAWLAVVVMVAGYGQGRGYPFWPLFVATALLGPLGPPVVLLAVTLAAGRRE